MILNVENTAKEEVIKGIMKSTHRCLSERGYISVVLVSDVDKLNDLPSQMVKAADVIATHDGQHLLKLLPETDNG